jgi:bacillithiol system protein YtxJ
VISSDVGLSIEQITGKSHEMPVLIFKHSYRCSISALALSRLKQSEQFPDLSIEFILVDVLKDRAFSNLVADYFHVDHESPQALLIKDGKCILNRSHMQIRLSEIAGMLDPNNS